MSNFNGCYNRAPLKTTALVQSGWVNDDFYYKSRKPLMVEIPDPMTKDCQYSKTHNDPKCKGCKHDNR